MTNQKAAALTGALFAAKGSATPAVQEKLLVDAREVRSPRMIASAHRAAADVAESQTAELAEFEELAPLETTELKPVLTLDETVLYMPTDVRENRVQRQLRVVCSIAAVAVLTAGLWFASSALVDGADKTTGAVESRGGATVALTPAAADSGPLAAPAAIGTAGGLTTIAAVAPIPAVRIDLPPLPARKPTLAAGAGNYVIQLSSVGSADAAQQEWIRFQETFPELLRDLPFTATRTALNDRRAVYGVQTGPFADLGSAREMCALLRAKQQDCLVIKR